MFAITTKYHGPTNHRGSRISATVQDDSGWKVKATVGYDHSLSGDDVFRKAAIALCEKLTAMGMTWSNPDNLISGTIPGGYVFVFTAYN